VNLFSQQQLNGPSPKTTGPCKARTGLSLASLIENTNRQQAPLDKKTKQLKMIFVYFVYI
jgi:hypothetical protein